MSIICKMKERKSSFLIGLAGLFVAVALLVSSCETGLGESVDTSAPDIAITYPPAASVIRGTFTFAGTCKDDKGVDSVTLTIRNTADEGADAETKYQAGEVQIEDNKKWSVSVNNYDPENPAYYNGWQLPDGKYELTVYATDGSGKTSGKAVRTFEVDNTAPVVILSSPGSVTSATAYGSHFNIVGKIADEHTVSSLGVTIYDNEGNVLDNTAEAPYTKTNISTAGGINEAILTYSAGGTDEENQRYAKIYGTNAKAGTTPFKCAFSIYDSAKEYVNPDETENKGQGNSTSTFYLNDDIYSTLLSGVGGGLGLSAANLMQIVNKTYAGTVNTAQVLETLKAAETNTKEKNLLFSLNPAVNPTWTVSGFSWDAEAPQNATKGQSVNIVVKSGLDGTPLKPETFVAYWKDFGTTAPDEASVAGFVQNPASGEKIAAYTDNASLSVAHEVSCNWPVDLPDTLLANHYYVFAMTGQDEKNLELVCNGQYGLIGLLSGTPPTIGIEKPTISKIVGDANVGDVAAGDTNGWEWNGEAAPGEEGATLESVGVSVNVVDSSTGETKQTLSGSSTSGNVTYSAETKKWSFLLPRLDGYSKCPNGYIYEYHATITAYDSNGKSTSVSRTASVDARGPIVTITSVTPTVGDAVNGKIEISYSVEETNLVDLNYQILVDGAEVKSESLKDPATQIVPSSGTIKVDTTTYTDNKSFEVKFTAKDGVDQTGVGTTTTYNKGVCYTINQSTDKPGISFSNATEGITQQTGISTADKGNLFGPSTNNKLICTVTDDDGIESLTVGVYTDAAGTAGMTAGGYTAVTDYSSQAGDKPSFTFSHTLPATEGLYYVKVSVTDNKNETTFWESATRPFAIAVDSGAPIIEVTSPKNGTYQGQSITVSGTLGEACTVSAEFIDANGNPVTETGATIGEVTGGTSWSVPVTVTTEKAYNMRFTATDGYQQKRSVTLNYIVDKTPPSFTVTSPAESEIFVNTSETFTVKGSYTENLSGAMDVDYSIATAEPEKTGAAYNLESGWEKGELSKHSEDQNGEWTINIAPDAWNGKTGQHTLYIAIRDNAGNVSLVDGNPSKTIKLTPDKDEPVLTETGIGDTVKKYFKADSTITFSGTVSDTTSGIKSVVVSLDGTSVTKNATITAGTWTSEWTVGSGKDIPTDGEKTFKITALDNSGRQIDLARSVTVDTKAPTISRAAFDQTVMATVEGKKVLCLDSSSYAKLSVTASDEGGSEIATVKYSVDGGAEVIMPGSGNYSASINFGKDSGGAYLYGDGEHTVTITATDNAGNSSTSTATITIDKMIPVTEISGETKASDAALELTITVTDTNPGVPTVTISRDGVSGKVETLTASKVDAASTETKSVYRVSVPFKKDTSPTAANNTWGLNADIYDDGTYTVTVNEKDANGRVADVKTWQIQKDSLAPVVTVNAVSDYIKDNFYKFTGTIVEANLDPAGLSARITPAPDGSSSASLAVSYQLKAGKADEYLWEATATGMGDRAYTVEITAKDVVGNSDTKTSGQITVDTLAPASTFAGANLVDGTGASIAGSLSDGTTYYAKETAAGKAFTFSGTLTESHFKSAEVSKNGGDATTLSSAAGEWTYSPAETADGTYAYKFTFEDLAGNVTENTITVVRDTKAPTLSLGNIKDDAENPTNVEGKTDFAITGSAPDDLAGLGKIEYRLQKKDGAYLLGGADSYETVNVATGATFTLPEINFRADGYGEGGYVLTVKASDKLGNATEDKTYTFYSDLAAPVVAVTAPENLIKTKDDVVLTGTVTESNGVTSIVVTDSLSGESKAVEIPDPDGSVYTWTLSLPDLTDGKHTFTVTAKDSVNRTGIATRTITTDKTAPVWDMPTTGTGAYTSDTPYISTTDYTMDDKKWYSTKNLDVQLKAKDATSGILKVEYSFNDADWTESSNGKFNVVAEEGSNTLYVLATDGALNTKKHGPMAFFVDTTAPNALSLETVNGSAAAEGTNTVFTNGSTDITLLLSAQDDAGAENGKSGVKTVSVTKIGSTRVTGIAATANEAGKFSITIPKSKLTSGGTVTFTVTDKVGNAAEFNELLTIDLDKDAPVVSQRALKDVINGKNNILGNINETEVNPNKVELYYYTAAQNVTTVPASLSGWTKYGFVTTDSGTDKGSADGKTGYESYNATKTQVLSFAFNNVDVDTWTGVTAQAPQKALFVLAVATDKAGNVSVTDGAITAANCKKYIVDLESDRPTISLTTVSWGDEDDSVMGSANYAKLKYSKELSGTITDDDGIAGVTIEYSTDDGANYNAATYSNGTWKITFADDNKYTIKFRVTDAAGKEFTSDATAGVQKIKLSGSNKNGITYGTSDNPSTLLYLVVDGKEPEVKYGSNKFVRYNGEVAETPAETLTAVGGTHKKFDINLEARDENGIESVSYTIPYKDGEEDKEYTVSGTRGAEAGGWIPWTLKADSSVLKTGTYTGTLSVTDGAGLVKTDTISVTVDNTAPNTGLTTPSATKPVFGNSVTATGFSEIGAGDTLEFLISTDGTTPPSEGNPSSWTGTNPDTSTSSPESGTVDVSKAGTLYGWQTIQDASASWKVVFDNGDSSETETHGKTLNDYIINYGVTGDDGTSITENRFTTIVNLWLWLRATDALGNVSEKAYPILLDPQGDRPWIEFGYPETNGNPVGGAVSFYGSAGDDVGVEAVFMQIISKKDNASAGYDFEEHSGFNLKTADLDKMANSGYTVYKMTTYGKPGQKEWNGSLAEGEKASDYGILATFSGGIWNITVNETGQFDPESGKTNPAALRVYAFDGTKVSLPATRDVYFDADSPVMGEKYLRHYGGEDGMTGPVSFNEAPTASQEYKDNIYINKDWFISFTLSDGDKVAALYVGESSVSAEEAKASMDTSNNVISLYGNHNAGQDKCLVNIPVDTTSGTVGAHYVYVKFADAKGNAGSYSFAVNHDKQAPELSGTIGEEVVQQNGWYSLSAKATENALPAGNQSGIARIGFYFVRKALDTEAKRIIDPMMKKGSSANNIPITASVTLEEGLYWMSQSVGRNSAKLNELTLTVANPNIHVGGIVRIDGFDYKITEMSDPSGAAGTVVSVNGKPEYSAATEEVKFAMACFVDNGVGEAYNNNPFTAAANGYGYGYQKPTSDDGDLIRETLESNGIWAADINSKNIPDGPIEIHYVAFDKAGNYATGSVTNAVVKNNAPRLANVTVGSDHNYDGSIGNAASGESRKYTETSLTWAQAEETLVDGVSTLNLGSETEAFISAKGTTVVKPEIIGGNGALYYSYKYAGGALTYKNSALLASDTGNANSREDQIAGGVAEIEIPEGSLKAAKDGIGKYEFTIWDSTEETYHVTDVDGNSVTKPTSQSANIVLWMKNDVNDTEKPVGKTKRFHWKGLKDNSIYGSEGATSFSDLQGHIELEGSMSNANPKVSGKIVIKGTAFDNAGIKSLKLTIPGMAAVTDKVVASWDFAKKDLTKRRTKTEDGSLENDGYHFEVLTDTETYTNDGHSISWKLELDTSKCKFGAENLPAKEGVTFDISVTDKNDKPSDSTAESKYTMDIVPYITRVWTTLSEVDGTNGLIDRSSLGHYPIYFYKNSNEENQTGGNYETIKIYGFNLKGAKYGANDLNASFVDATASEKENVSMSSELIPASGEFALTVNDVQTCNNSNNDDACGSYTTSDEIPIGGSKTIYANYYNRQPNGANNNNLTDNVYFDLWQLNAKAAVPMSGSVDDPQMKISPKTGKIGFAFGNGSSAFSMPNAAHSWIYWTYDFDRVRNFALAYSPVTDGTTTSTADSYAWCAAVGQDTHSGGGDPFVLESTKWREEHGWYDKDSGFTSGYSVALERISVDGKVMQDRIQSPSIATTDTSVYMAYYDSYKGEIRYKAGKLEDETHESKQSSDSYHALTNDRYEFGFFKNEATGQNVNYSTANVQLVAASSSTLGRAGPYVSIATVNGGANAADDVVVMVWYDAVAGHSRYSYLTDPTKEDGRKGNRTGDGWSTPKDVFGGNCSGEYCQIAVDKKGGVHIAAYDSAESDVWYAYLPSYDSATAKACKVDTYDSTGVYLTLDVALDASDKPLPQIGYYSMGSARPKYATWNSKKGSLASLANIDGVDSDESFTENWIVTNIPTASNVRKSNTSSKVKQNINVGVWKNADGKITDSTPGISSYTNNNPGMNAENFGDVYGNGTKNAVLGYMWGSDSSAFIETAQMK